MPPPQPPLHRQNCTCGGCPVRAPHHQPNFLPSPPSSAVYDEGEGGEEEESSPVRAPPESPPYEEEEGEEGEWSPWWPGTPEEMEVMIEVEVEVEMEVEMEMGMSMGMRMDVDDIEVEELIGGQGWNWGREWIVQIDEQRFRELGVDEGGFEVDDAMERDRTRDVEVGMAVRECLARMGIWDRLDGQVAREGGNEVGFVGMEGYDEDEVDEEVEREQTPQCLNEEESGEDGVVHEGCQEPWDEIDEEAYDALQVEWTRWFENVNGEDGV